MVPAIWLTLNGIFLAEEGRLLLQRTRAGIASVVERSLEAAASNAAPAAPENAQEYEGHYMSPFEALMH